MKVLVTPLSDVKLIKPTVHTDSRGFFLETYQQDRYQNYQIGPHFVQDNLSYSLRGTLRGLHLQWPYPQGKLIYALQGEIFDVAVDVRVGSPTFGQWTGARLSDENNHQLWIPQGFAHGFCVLSKTAFVAYKCTNFYHSETEITLRWDDPDVNIDWPLTAPQLSDKDAQAPHLSDLSPDCLPRYGEVP